MAEADTFVEVYLPSLIKIDHKECASNSEPVLPELHYNGLHMLTPRTFKGTEIEARLLRLDDARYISAEHSGHSGLSLIGVFSSVYSENVICDSSCFRREAALID